MRIKAENQADEVEGLTKKSAADLDDDFFRLSCMSGR